MKWFGLVAFAPICDDLERVPTPIGALCLYCDETIELIDCGLFVPNGAEGIEEQPWHQECFLRTVIGSVGHQQKRCECYGDVDISEEGLSPREAAREAREFNRAHRVKLVTE